MCGTRLHSLEGVGPVDEVEVQVLQLQVLQGLQEWRLHVLRVMLCVPQLGCDEHVLPSQALTTKCITSHRINTFHVELVQWLRGEETEVHLPLAELLLQGFSDLRLIAVDGGAVDVAISSFQSPSDCLFHLWTSHTTWEIKILAAVVIVTIWHRKQYLSRPQSLYEMFLCASSVWNWMSLQCFWQETEEMSAARTFPGSLFHVPSPRRGILRPVLRTAKSFMPLSCTLTTKAENINQVFFVFFF